MKKIVRSSRTLVRVLADSRFFHSHFANGRFPNFFSPCFLSPGYIGEEIPCDGHPENAVFDKAALRSMFGVTSLRKTERLL